MKNPRPKEEKITNDIRKHFSTEKKNKMTLKLKI